MSTVAGENAPLQRALQQPLMLTRLRGERRKHV